MNTVKVRYDGRVFVPEKAVEVPVGFEAEIVLPVKDGQQITPLTRLAELAYKYPIDPDWPADGAEQHDHYLYGTPKRHDSD